VADKSNQTQRTPHLKARFMPRSSHLFAADHTSAGVILSLFFIEGPLAQHLIQRYRVTGAEPKRRTGLVRLK
jgi:hypothetical protein